jgi:hypothetical protein
MNCLVGRVLHAMPHRADCPCACNIRLADPGPRRGPGCLPRRHPKVLLRSGAWRRKDFRLSCGPKGQAERRMPQAGGKSQQVNSSLNWRPNYRHTTRVCLRSETMNGLRLQSIFSSTNQNQHCPRYATSNYSGFVGTGAEITRSPLDSPCPSYSREQFLNDGR